MILIKTENNLLFEAQEYHWLIGIYSTFYHN